MSDPRPRRLAALADGLTAAHVDGLLVTSLANVRYLTGFSGSSALLLVTQRDVVLITDFRYQTQVETVRAQIPALVERIVAHASDLELSEDMQRVRLSNGQQVEARLVVLATGFSAATLLPV